MCGGVWDVYIPAPACHPEKVHLGMNSAALRARERSVVEKAPGKERQVLAVGSPTVCRDVAGREEVGRYSSIHCARPWPVLSLCQRLARLCSIFAMR